MWEATHSVSTGCLNGWKLHHTHRTDVWETRKGGCMSAAERMLFFSPWVPLCASTSRQARGSGPAAQAPEAARTCWKKTNLNAKILLSTFLMFLSRRLWKAWGIFPTHTPTQNSHLSSIYLLCCNLLLSLNNASEMQAWADHSAESAVLLKCDGAHLPVLDQRGRQGWAGLGTAAGLSSLFLAQGYHFTNSK